MSAGQDKLKKIRKFWWLAGALFFLLIFWWRYSLINKIGFLSPLGGGGIFPKLAPDRSEVIGFLPFWNINDSVVDFSVVDQLIYFGLTVGEDGHFIKTQGWETEPGWVHLQNNKKLDSIFRAGKKARKKILFSAICFDPYIIDLVVSDNEVRDNLINDIVTVVNEWDFDGVDIDFEYFPGSNNIDNFGSRYAEFLTLLGETLKKQKPKAIISTDIYPKAFIYDWPYDLKKTSEAVDQIIMMAYDFTQSNSSQAGPVAPIKGENEHQMSIVQALESSLDKVDKKKLVLGIPLYGYEWQTSSQDHKSPTYITRGITATYDRVIKLVQEKNLKVNWDETAYSPWVVYLEGWVTKQIYFDNLKSISFKIELAGQLQLKGVAFWALGYEGNRPEFWEQIKRKI